MYTRTALEAMVGDDPRRNQLLGYVYCALDAGVCLMLKVSKGVVWAHRGPHAISESDELRPVAIQGAEAVWPSHSEAVAFAREAESQAELMRCGFAVIESGEE